MRGVFSDPTAVCGRDESRDGERRLSRLRQEDLRGLVMTAGPGMERGVMSRRWFVRTLFAFFFAGKPVLGDGRVIMLNDERIRSMSEWAG